MKNLKYILLIGFIMFFSINGVEAESCTYGNKSLYIKCTTTSGNNASCELGGTNTGSIYMALDGNHMLSNDTVRKCDKMYYVLSNDSTQQRIRISQLYNETDYNRIKNGWLSDVSNYHLLTKMSDEDNEVINADLSKFNGKECFWKSNDNNLAYVCKVTNGKINCNLSCATGSDCKKKYSFSTSVGNDFISSDFINNNTFSCPSSSLYPVISNSIYDGTLRITSLSKKTSNSSITFSRTNTSPVVRDYEKDPTYMAAKAEADKYCNSPLQEYANKCAAAKQTMENIKNKYENPEETPNNPETPSEPREDLDLDNFCKENVLRVFTTIGWVFFILKILIPLILIVFGVIDISKAVLSSKDDEIKKSAKTLVMRIIAGIIIFFIPSVLNFVVNLIGDRATGVYDENHGTFKDCTSCMLSPGQDYCGVKVGE